MQGLVLERRVADLTLLKDDIIPRELELQISRVLIQMP